jgi:hypothetical protein
MTTSNNSVVIDSLKIDFFADRTELKWFISEIKKDDVFEVQYQITSAFAGHMPVNQTKADDPVNYSRLYYRDYQDSIRIEEFPADSIWVKNYSVSDFIISTREDYPATSTSIRIYVRRNANGQGVLDFNQPDSIKPLDLYCNGNTAQGWKDTIADWTFMVLPSGIGNPNLMALGLPYSFRDTSKISIPFHTAQGLVTETNTYIIVRAVPRNSNDTCWFSIELVDTNTYYSLDTVAIFTIYDTAPSSEPWSITLRAGEYTTFYALGFEWDTLDNRFGKFMGARNVTWTIDTSGISQDDTIFIPGNTLKIFEWNQIASANRDTTLSIGFKRPGVYHIIIQYDSTGYHYEDDVTVYVTPDSPPAPPRLEFEPGDFNPATTSFRDTATIVDGSYLADTVYFVMRDRFGNYIGEEKIVSVSSKYPDLITATVIFPDSTSLVFMRGGYQAVPGGVFHDTIIVTGESGFADTLYINIECFIDGIAIYGSPVSNISEPRDSIVVKTTDSITLYTRGFFITPPGDTIEYGLVNADWELLAWPDQAVRIVFNQQNSNVSSATIPNSPTPGMGMIAITYTDPVQNINFRDTLSVDIVVQGGQATMLNIFRVDSLGNEVAYDTVPSGSPLYIKIDAYDQFGFRTNNWDPDSIIFSNDLPADTPANLAWHFGDSEKRILNVTQTWIKASPVSGEDMFGVILVKQGINNITVFDSLLTKNSAVIRVTVISELSAILSQNLVFNESADIDTNCLLVFPVPANKYSDQIQFSFYTNRSVRAVLTIYDLGGSRVHEKSADFSLNNHRYEQCLFESWNMRNFNGRMITSGGYIAVLKLTYNYDGTTKTMITKLAVGEE